MIQRPIVRLATLLTLLADCSGDSDAGTTSPVAVPSANEAAATGSSVTRTVGTWRVTITDLGLLPGGSFSTAYDINNLGEVVGIATDAACINRRVIWKNSVIVDTLPQPGSAVATATQLNEQRQLVGFATQSSSIGYGVFWNHGTALKLQPLSGSAASGAAANGINSVGDVAGGGTGGGGASPVYQHAGIWRNGLLLRDIGVIPGGNYAMAYDINGAGQVTGTGTAGSTGSRQYAFMWSNGVYTILPDLPGSFLQSVGRSINGRGEVAGQSNGGDPVVWKNGLVQALPMPTRLANTISEINDSGDVVGTVTLAATTATSIRRGQSVTMRAVITDPDGVDGPWAWTLFGGNGPATGSLATPGTLTASRTYAKAGSDSVRLQVRDGHGGTGTSNTITVRVR